MDYPFIKLDRNHHPINPNLIINSQVDYDYYIAVLNYLYNQINLGFKPKYLVSLHYQNPAEYCRPIRETNKTLGFGDRYGYKTSTPLWNSVSWDRFVEYNRNDIDLTTKNAGKVRNLILKIIYGVKRLNRPDKYEFPNLFFFHEKGKVKLQYHTHILLPDCNYDKDELLDIFNTSIRERCKCLSRWKKIDITDVKYDMYGMMGYVNKETNSLHTALDPINSIPIIPHK
jgi:hypothetical protein